MTIHKWWHHFVRRRTNPIPEDVAVVWKKRLSIAYGIIAWNAFGAVLYSMYQGKADWADYYGLKTEEEKQMKPALSWANTLGIKNAKVYRISGFEKVGEYEIVDGQIKQDEPHASSEEFDE